MLLIYIITKNQYETLYNLNEIQRNQNLLVLPYFLRAQTPSKHYGERERDRERESLRVIDVKSLPTKQPKIQRWRGTKRWIEAKWQSEGSLKFEEWDEREVWSVGEWMRLREIVKVRETVKWRVRGFECLNLWECLSDVSVLSETVRFECLRARLVDVFKNWKLLFKNFCGNTCGWKSVCKYVKCCLKTENCCLETLTKHPLNLLRVIWVFWVKTWRAEGKLNLKGSV